MVGKRSGSGCRDIGLNYLHDLKMLIEVLVFTRLLRRVEKWLLFYYMLFSLDV